MSLLKLPSELLAEVLSSMPRSSIATLACAHRSLAAELSSARQDWSWRALCKRDWGVAKPALVADEAAAVPEAEAAAAAAASSVTVDRSIAASPPFAAMRASPTADQEEDDDGIELPQPLPGESWRAVYRRHAIHFGTAASAYSRVAPLWHGLLTWLEAHAHELPPITQTLAPTFPPADSASADFAAAQAAAQGLQPLPAALDFGRLSSELAKAQTAFRLFQRQVRAQLLKELEAEEDEARSGGDEKRQSKRTRSRAAGAAATAAGSSSDDDMKSSASSSASHSPSHAPASAAADMDVQEHKSAADDSSASAAVVEPPFSDVTLPADLQCLLLLHNGQNLVTRRKDLATGLFGSFSFYNFEAHYRLQPLEIALAEGLAAVQQRAVAVLSQARKKRAAAKNKRSRSSGSDAATAASAAPSTDADVRSKALAEVSDQLRMLLPIVSSPVEPSNDFFLDCASGRVVRQYADGSLFEAAPSVLDFFSRWVRDLAGGMFACSPRTGINRFPLHSDTGSVTTTRGVQIRTSVLFVPEQSIPAPIADAVPHAQGAQPRFFFAYHVQITHDGSTQLRAQLVSRHWIIEDETGHVEEVQGHIESGSGISIIPRPERTVELTLL